MDLDLRRKNFLEKSLMYFRYLTNDYEYQVIDIKNAEYHDEIVFESSKYDRRIVIYNSYHPVDYGFEIQWYRPSVSTSYSDREFQQYLLIEYQDDDQEYLKEFAESLKNEYEPILKGKKWFD